MSIRRILAIIGLAVVWLLILMLWMIGLGYEAHGFRLPAPFHDGLSDVLLFYVPLVAMAWLASQPLRRMRNRPNNNETVFAEHAE